MLTSASQLNDDYANDDYVNDDYVNDKYVNECVNDYVNDYVDDYVNDYVDDYVSYFSNDLQQGTSPASPLTQPSFTSISLNLPFLKVGVRGTF